MECAPSRFRPGYSGAGGGGCWGGRGGAPGDTPAPGGRRGRAAGGAAPKGRLNFLSASAGNLDARRDWGHAREYVQAMWLMLQKDEPDDYVIATGEQHTVREFADAAFRHVGLDYRDHVVINQDLLRPAEVETLLGDATKARQRLGWAPRCTFPELVKEMVETDLRLLGG
jgi:GDP-mannose 4,6-dehydratase